MVRWGINMDEFVHRPLRSPLQTESTRDKPQRLLKSTNPAPSPSDKPASGPPPPKQPPKKPGRKFSFHLPRPKTKLQWGLTLAATALLLAGTGFLVYWFLIRKTEPPVTPTTPTASEPEPESATVASRVSGRQLDRATAERPIYAVQIENSPDARPQSGLREADIVHEAVAEGGITRFNALYHDHKAANVGPIRSLRPYYIDWFLPYGAGIVHAGGSAEALQDISELNVQDMNHDSSHFRRVSNRYAPHNLYSTGAQLVDLFTSKNYKNADPVPSLPRKDAAPSDAPTAVTINLNISSALYNVVFTYDKASNSYLRTLGGSPHVDADSGDRIAPDVVIVPVITKGVHSDGVHTTYNTRGSGTVFVFQDGTVTKGTWTKPERKSQWQLTDAEGKPIKLNSGQTWFTIIDAVGSVSYSP